jgi:hypothetical protein
MTPRGDVHAHSTVEWCKRLRDPLLLRQRNVVVQMIFGSYFLVIPLCDSRSFEADGKVPASVMMSPKDMFRQKVVIEPAFPSFLTSIPPNPNLEILATFVSTSWLLNVWRSSTESLRSFRASAGEVRHDFLPHRSIALHSAKRLPSQSSRRGAPPTDNTISRGGGGVCNVLC